jgi:hypothetical protein
MLNLDSRPATLGVSLGTPTEKHGDDRVPAKNIRIKNVLLTKDELNDLLGDKHAWDMLYVEKKGKAAEPIFAGKLAALAVLGKWRESSISISFGLKPYEVNFSEARISRVALECQTGGQTAMSFMLSALKANISGALSSLDDYLGTNVNVAVEFGEPADEDEDDDEDKDQDSLDLTPQKGTSDQPRAH